VILVSGVKVVCGALSWGRSGAPSAWRLARLSAVAVHASAGCTGGTFLCAFSQKRQADSQLATCTCTLNAQHQCIICGRCPCCNWWCADSSKSDDELVAMAKNWTIVGKDLLTVVSCKEP